MKLGYTIIYVSDVTASLAFFEAAFGFTQKLFVPTGEYGELNTGETTLAFAQHALGNSHFPEGYVRADQSDKPLGMEIALLTADVASAHDKAVKWGPCRSTHLNSNLGGKPSVIFEHPMAP